MTLHQRVAVLLRVWAAFLAVGVGLRLHRLPLLVEQLAGTPVVHDPELIEPVRLGRLVIRCLTVFGKHPRCLVVSLVLFRLLRQQGHRPQLVIGLPTNATSEEAHAWVEIAGVDVGPPPGKRGHLELARYS